MKDLGKEAGLTFEMVATGGKCVTMTTDATRTSLCVVSSGGALHLGPLLGGRSDGNGGSGKLVDHSGPIVL